MVTGTARVVSWICRLGAAGILAQTLFFKFTAAPESVSIFSKLGVEPWRRIATGVYELITVLLLLLPRTPAVGALLACGFMIGPQFTHFTSLGIEVQGDGGLLFVLGLVTFICALIVPIIHRRELPIVGARF